MLTIAVLYCYFIISGSFITRVLAHVSVRLLKSFFSGGRGEGGSTWACYIQKYLATLLSKESMAFSTVKPVLNLWNSINSHAISGLGRCHLVEKISLLVLSTVTLPAKLTSSDYKFPAPIVCTAVWFEDVVQSVTWNEKKKAVCSQYNVLNNVSEMIN